MDPHHRLLRISHDEQMVLALDDRVTVGCEIPIVAMDQHDEGGFGQL